MLPLVKLKCPILEQLLMLLLDLLSSNSLTFPIVSNCWLLYTLPIISSGGFKSQQCQQLLTGPPTKKKKREKGKGKAAQATRSKGPSDIIGRGGRTFFLSFFFFFFCFSLFETTKICFGATKMDISTGKKVFYTGTKYHWRAPTISCWQGTFP